MSSLDKIIAHIQGLRRKFEGLLETARGKSYRAPEAPGHGTARLREITAFGTNPGNLRMLVHVPERLPNMAPLVVALHGCSQTADDYDHGTGWSSLADRLGFAVLYPEQKPANNPKNCFSWFLPGDTTRDHGEACSIQQMVGHAIVTFGIDRRRVFVTGLSAGGAMASVMLATYPEAYAGGAIIAGLPYGCAHSVQQAFDAMFTEQSIAARALGDRVRTALRHRGPWPKLSVWHGTADSIVKPSNSENIIRQWTDVHGLSAAPSCEETIGSHTRRVWNDVDGNTVIEAFSISGMAHGVPLALTMREESCGATGPFFLEAGISSTHRIAGFWRLGEGLAEAPRAAKMVSEPRQTRAGGRAVVIAGAASGGANHSDDASFEPTGEQDARRAHDPNLAIEAAFRAAGVPIPKLPSGRPGTKADVAPGPIIAAALKAAGLIRT